MNLARRLPRLHTHREVLWAWAFGIALGAALVSIAGCGDGRSLTVVPLALAEMTPGQMLPACDIGERDTFQANNCDGTNGAGEGHVLCFTHDGPVIGCMVAYAAGVGGEGAPSYLAECVATCPPVTP